ncbi:hypothetical protein PMIN05_012391 [Paraphaeosphaeria minitans]
MGCLKPGSVAFSWRWLAMTIARDRSCTCAPVGTGVRAPSSLTSHLNHTRPHSTNLALVHYLIRSLIKPNRTSFYSLICRSLEQRRPCAGPITHGYSKEEENLSSSKLRGLAM